jgi:signal peptidase II
VDHHPSHAALDGAVPELHRRGSLDGAGRRRQDAFDDAESIFMDGYLELATPDVELLAKWGRIREIREAVNKDIETLRAAGQVGSSLQANVQLTVSAEDHAILFSLGEDLKFVFITSAIELIAGDAVSAVVIASNAVKCERCWHYRDDVGGCRPPHPVWPLHQQPVWRGRSPRVCLMARTFGKSSGAGMLQWLGLAFIILLVDQFTKVLIVGYYHLGDSTYVTSFFNVVRVHNAGAAFSFLAGASGWQRWFFTVLGLVAAIVIVWMLRSHPGQKLFSFAMACILGGAIGNVIDRMMYGYVVDFLDFHWRGMHFPAFNVADSAISIGAACLILDELLRVRKS